MLYCVAMVCYCLLGSVIVVCCCSSFLSYFYFDWWIWRWIEVAEWSYSISLIWGLCFKGEKRLKGDGVKE